MTTPEVAVVVAVHDLLARYAHACDDRRLDDFVALFTDDASFVVAGQDFTGPGGARQWLEGASANPAGTHVTVNVVVTPDGPDRATSVAAFVFYRRQGGTGPWELYNIGRYHDTVVHDGDQWRFARREITLH